MEAEVAVDLMEQVLDGRDLSMAMMAGPLPPPSYMSSRRPF